MQPGLETCGKTEFNPDSVKGQKVYLGSQSPACSYPTKKLHVLTWQGGANGAAARLSFPSQSLLSGSSSCLKHRRILV